MVGDGRSGRCHLGIATYQFFRAGTIFIIQQVGIAVQMVKIFQQGKIQGCFDIAVIFTSGQKGSQINSQLFIGNGMLKNGFVFRLQTTDPFLLHLLYAADHSQFAPKIIILTVTAELMAEPLGFEFGAVHEDNADLGVRMDGAEMIGFRIKFIPVHKKLV